MALRLLGSVGEVEEVIEGALPQVLLLGDFGTSLHLVPILRRHLGRLCDGNRTARPGRAADAVWWGALGLLVLLCWWLFARHGVD